MNIPKSQNCKCWLDYPNPNCKSWCAYYENISQHTSTRKTICRLKNIPQEFDKNKAIEMLQSKLTCLNRTTDPVYHCNGECDYCALNYRKGTIGEQKELIKFLINTLLK